MIVQIYKFYAHHDKLQNKIMPEYLHLNGLRYKIMKKPLKVGILRESKNPPDRRVPLTPPQIIWLQKKYPDVSFCLQPSNDRCYSNSEYEQFNIPLKEDLQDCDILIGIKEVDKLKLIPGKTYLFFAHVAKRQPHNRTLLREILRKKIKLIDFEYLATEKGERVVAFGRFAGIVGAYNGLMAKGLRTGRFNLKPAWECHDLVELWDQLNQIDTGPGVKVLITGQGRVAGGALETLARCNFLEISPDDFLTKEFSVPVVCRIGPEHYTRHRKGIPFSFDYFVKHPEEFESAFLPFTRVTDILITGHYWDPRSPVFFSKEDMKSPDFKISVIADISCDINGAIPSTLRATTMNDPFYGYNPSLEIEELAFSRPENITVMSIDNLPGELPRDASEHFGTQLMKSVMDELFSVTETGMIQRATITDDGKLTDRFSYLKDFTAGGL
jgi:saccharopine dehydrogenase (NAD+, L-lysine forming)